MTLVSVIVPNYNYAEALPLCLKALQEQTYSPLEILVVDDGSTDGSAEIAEAMGVTVIRTPNGGVSRARNLGVAHAKGDVFFFVDSDVALAPDAIELSVRLLDSDPKIGAACGIYDAEPLIRHSRVEEYRCMQGHYWRLDSDGNVSFLFSSLCAIPRRVWEDIGPFKSADGLQEEVDYGERLSAKYDLRLDSRIRGRHDDESELWPMLRKLFKRGRMRIPLYARRKKFAQGYESPLRAYASIAALAGTVALPLPLLAGAWWAAVPVGLLAASLLLDAGMYRYVLRHRGFAFLAYYTGVHYLLNLTIASSVGVGVLHWLVSGRFRRLYDVEPVAAASF
ncbi:glycosyltransferase family 2 protein [Actinoplanes sp. TFC3]|uniref:glycosyltransferase family 2 protein n=1 Tax=Actinoplanes sp. TFC3 TaxID=1710355 RepID=UPI0008358226|nr:glycosyltransferase family 2 protein [Actinoplanes sp. TFC3]